MKHLIPKETIEHKIYLIRGHKVMIDRDLAELYGVETRVLVQSVKRNIRRFPEDFTFQVTEQEAEILRSQIVISKKGSGGRRYLPYVFTEQGIAMLSSILKSEQAIQVNIAIMRAFVRIKAVLSNHKQIADKLDQLERKTNKHDKQIRVIFDVIRRLIAEPDKPKRRIGFHN